jgi:hypothetical protein
MLYLLVQVYVSKKWLTKFKQNLVRIGNQKTVLSIPVSKMGIYGNILLDNPPLYLSHSHELAVFYYQLQQLSAESSPPIVYHFWLQPNKLAEHVRYAMSWMNDIVTNTHVLEMQGWGGKKTIGVTHEKTVVENFDFGKMGIHA